MHQDLVTGERALQQNALAWQAAQETDDAGSVRVPEFRQLPLGAELLSGAEAVLLQLPKTLAELDEVAAAVARHAAPGVLLLAGGRVKHMSLGMNGVLERHFDSVQPQLARQKSRVIVASHAKAGQPPANAFPSSCTSRNWTWTSQPTEPCSPAPNWTSAPGSC